MIAFSNLEQLINHEISVAKYLRHFPRSIMLSAGDKVFSTDIRSHLSFIDLIIPGPESPHQEIRIGVLKRSLAVIQLVNNDAARDQGIRWPGRT